MAKYTNPDLFLPEEVIEIMKQKFQGKELEEALWELLNDYHTHFEPPEFHKYKEDLTKSEIAKMVAIAKDEVGLI